MIVQRGPGSTPLAIDLRNSEIARKGQTNTPSPLASVYSDVLLTDLNVDVPVIYKDKNGIYAQIEHHSSKDICVKSQFGYTESLLRDKFSSQKIYLSDCQFVGILNPKDLFTCRILRAQEPEIAKIKYSGNQLTIWLYKGSYPKENRSSLVSLAKERMNVEKVHIKYILRNLSPSSTFYEMQNKSLPYISAVWNSRRVFEYTSNLYVDNLQKKVEIATEDINQKDNILSKKGARFYEKLSRVQELKDEVSLDGIKIIRAPVLRQSIRYLISELPDYVEAIKVESGPHMFNVQALIEDNHAPLSLKKLFGQQEDLSLPMNPMLVSHLNKSRITEKTFDLIPVSWGLKGVEESLDGKRVVLYCQNLSKKITNEDIEKISSELGVDVKLESEVYQSLPNQNFYVTTLASRIPTGYDIIRVEENSINHSLRLISRRPIPDYILKKMSQLVNTPIDNQLEPRPRWIQPALLSQLDSLKFATSIFSQNGVKRSSAKVTGYGGCKEIGGSCLLLSMQEVSVLLDYGGKFEERKEPEIADELLKDIDFIYISHAHFDHIGWMLRLLSRLEDLNARPKIIMTEPTYILGNYVLCYLNSAGEGSKIASKPKGIPADQLCIVRQGIKYQLSNDTYFTAYNSGHLPGSTMAKFETSDTSFLYTGDMHFGNSRVLNQAEICSADVVLMECTNGKVVQSDRQRTEEDFIHAVKQTIQVGGTVLIPALVQGRSMEVLSVLHLMRDFFLENRLKIDVDGSIPDMIKKYAYYLNSDPSLFNSENAKLLQWVNSPETILRFVNKRSRPSVISKKGPKVIIASSGMLRGLAADYFQHLRFDERNLLALTCYQPERTKGGRLLAQKINGAYHGEFEGTAMQVMRFNFSAHSTQTESIDFIEKAQIKNLLLNHGELDSLHEFKEALQKLPIKKRATVMEKDLSYVISNKQV